MGRRKRKKKEEPKRTVEIRNRGITKKWRLCERGNPEKEEARKTRRMNHSWGRERETETENSRTKNEHKRHRGREWKLSGEWK